MSVEFIFGQVPDNHFRVWDTFLNYFEPLASEYSDDDTTEIMVNDFENIYVEKGSRLYKTGISFANEQQLKLMVDQLAVALDQPLDARYPHMDARLPDSSRVCVTYPQITPAGITFVLRKAPKVLLTFDDLVRFGSISVDMVKYVEERVAELDNFMLSGNTGSGKTTVLRAASVFVEKGCRMGTVEDTLELYLKSVIPNSFAMEAPIRRREDDGPIITLAELIPISLRQRLDRLWVGELRTAFAVDAFLQSMTIGMTGCAATIHANSCRDMIHRGQYLLASKGVVSYELAGIMLLNSLDMLIHMGRDHRTYGRKCLEICQVREGKVKTVFEYNKMTNEHEYMGEGVSYFDQSPTLQQG